MSSVLSGVGQLRSGYQVVADLSDCRLDFAQTQTGKILFTAKSLVLRTGFIPTTQKLEFGMWMGRSWWVWSNVRALTEIDPGKIVELIGEGVPVAKE